jgi:uncharacterized protein YfdQ (DUF2303 family)
MIEDPNIIAEIRNLAREAGVAQTNEKVHYLLAPEGSTLISLKDQQYPHGIPPERVIANLNMQDAASFCSYVNSFKDDRTRLFADTTLSALGFLAIIDYHPAAASTDAGAAQFLSHRAKFALRHSEEWKLWSGLDGKLVPQDQFAEFLEDNRSDIVTPDSATMLEVAKDLQANSSVNFASKINSQNGSATLRFDEQIDTKVTSGQIIMPESFTISVPVFFGEAPIEITARLRFRISEGKLKFQYKLYRPVEVISRAFDVARAAIASATTLEVLLGTIG